LNGADIRTLYEYNCWANERILGAAAGVADDLFASARLGYCGLRETLVHICGAERRWRLRWQSQPSAAMLAVQEVPTLMALRGYWDAEQRQMRLYLSTVGDAELSDTFAYRRANGTLISSTRWHTMAHMINHGTQHRAELALLLTELGYSPGNIDLNVFLSGF
jgi:uncharacterized damage-inducible protein DinB